MITLPPGFDVALFFSEFFTLAAPFVASGFMISAAFVVFKILRNI